MDKEKFQKLSVEYFQGKLSLDQLVSELEAEIDFLIERVPLPKDERVMLIANHPSGEEALNLPAEKIAGMKGGNYCNFPDFRFPILRQLMLKRSLDRRFFTIAHDIGWRDAMQEMGHLLIRSTGNGRCQEIISRMKNDKSSLVIFPEGGVRDLQVFKTGFFHIACDLGIRQIVLGVFSPVLSLEKQNVFRVVSIENIGPFVDPVLRFVETQRRRIENALRT